MPPSFYKSVALIFAAFGLGLPACAVPQVSNVLTRPHAYCGHFGKVRLPKLNIVKAVRATTYTVRKTAATGGKTAVETYQVWRVVSPTGKALPPVPRLK